MKGLWPFYLVAAVLLLASRALFYFGVTIWAGIAVGWLGLGLLGYGLIFQFYPPTPLIIKNRNSSTLSRKAPRPFSFRDVGRDFPFLAIVLVMVAVAPLWLVFFVLGSSTDRLSASSKWRRSFPNSTRIEIREFLDTMVQAFLGNPIEKHYWFPPDERLIEVYQEFYATDSPDIKEIESFAQALKKRYKINFISLYMTVGELYAVAKTRNSTQQAENY